MVSFTRSGRILGVLAILAAGCGAGECPAGFIDMGNVCIDLSSDPANCGAFGNVCPEGHICENGTCVLTCPGGTTECAGVCRDLSGDFYNCGSCGFVCATGYVCVEGSCVTDCPEGYSECSGTCKNLENDPSNCGECGLACAAGEVCSAGSCAFTCPAGYTDCSGSCADLMTDHGNCGECGNECGPGHVCSAGSCQVSCYEGLTLCSGACRDLMRDPGNCGSCGTACGTGEVCYDGACTTSCPGGFTDCSGSCRDLSSDRLNCGACETECAEGEICESGSCVPSCGTGLVDCSGECSDLSSDPDNCGSCGVACGMSEACVSGSCAAVTISGAPFYALPYDYFNWDANAAELLFRAVTYGFSSMPVVGAVQECVDMTSSTSSSAPGGPYLGEYHATLAALEYAGFPPSNIVEFADEPAAAAALGTYNVLLFMEQEMCTPSGSAWTATVSTLITSGGRVVVTTPRGSTDTFIAGIGLFGTGSGTSVSAPYVAVAHPFWGTLTHPGYFSGTDAWNWTAPGMLVLGHQASDSTNVTVWCCFP